MSIETKGMPKAATLANVTALLAVAEELQNRAEHLPGLGVMYGPSGYGKSIAATVVAVSHHAAYVEVKDFMTRKSFLEAVAVELGLRPGRTLAEAAALVGEELARTQRLLIVDEADILADRNALEIVRSLHMSSGSPILLIGEEALPGKIRRFERIHNRVLTWAPAQPASLADARQLATIYCGRVAFDDDLLDHIVRKSQGRVRRIVVNLDRVEKDAVRARVDRADRAWWGDRDLYTGDAPARKVPQ
ncbi:AAA family ATPase [Segnochrobactrum spirostomi]|uniref:ATP-binding protein n=1 Tax=Segnochrobactrum spirostomi TaxID=2608987 RepID=A0A6A7Y4L1_9HYPH|nr:ATP-binding protein [Segnochrobactrum spirostomi]MQT13676.1 ATP-binding protein [Segnochrobactrum spirostomi]